MKSDCIASYLSNDLRELILQCLEMRDVIRPTFQEIGESPFIRNLQDSLKDVNLIVSQVEEFTQKSIESTEALSRMDKDSRRGLRVLDLS